MRSEKQPNQDRDEISEESERNSSGSSADEEEMEAEPLKAAPYVPPTRRGPEQIRILSSSKPLDLPTQPALQRGARNRRPPGWLIDDGCLRDLPIKDNGRGRAVNILSLIIFFHRSSS